MQAWQATVQNEQGNIVFNPSVTVYLEDGVTLASIFNEDGSPKVNPFIGSLEGFVQFWANPGVYKVLGANGSDLTELWEVSLTDYDRYVSYADFIGSYIPGRVDAASALVGDVLVSWRRDPAGPIGPTADGGMWSPADDVVMPQHFGALGDNITDDTAAFTTALSYLDAAGGGTFYMPPGRYVINGDLTVSSSYIAFQGASKTATIIDFKNTGGLRVGRIHDFSIGGFSVLNALGDGVTFGVIVGPKANMAWGRIYDVATNFSSGDGIVFGDAYMLDISGLRSQNAGTVGINFGAGYNTSISVRDCHSKNAGGDGWVIKNISYSDLSACGCDDAVGYGYHLENLAGVRVEGGCERAGNAALHFHNDTATTDTIKAFKATQVNMWELDSNSLNAAVGHFAHFTASAFSTDSGEVVLRECSNRNPPASDNIRIDSGKYHIRIPRGGNEKLARLFTGGARSVVGLDDNAVLHGDPISVTAATNIAQLRPAVANGVAVYGGKVTVYVTGNNLQSSSRNAVYELLISRGVGTSDLVLIGQAGNVSGTLSDEASFTFSLDSANNQLVATPIGATSGDFYFHLSCTGNIDAVNL